MYDVKPNESMVIPRVVLKYEFVCVSISEIYVSNKVLYILVIPEVGELSEYVIRLTFSKETVEASNVPVHVLLLAVISIVAVYAVELSMRGISMVYLPFFSANFKTILPSEVAAMVVTPLVPSPHFTELPKESFVPLAVM